jgi:hypothetical protein
MGAFKRGHHNRHYAVDSLKTNKHLYPTRLELSDLLDNFETVRIVAMENVGSHESEDRHYIVEDGIGCQSRQSGHQQQRLVKRLRIIRNWRRVSNGRINEGPTYRESDPREYPAE